MKTSLVLFLVSVLCAVNQAPAQDPVKLSPKYYKVLLENEHVRVLEVRIKAGEKEPMHSHPAGVVYSFKDVKAKATMPDAKSVEIDRKAGTAIWSEPVSHAWEVLSGETHVLLIEMKSPKTTKEAPAKK